MDKVAMYKDYIEKTALNAQKAREMAKDVGVVADGDWKWALRKLRNMKTGDVLKGKELAEAKQGMGLLPNNAWQKVKSQSRSLASKTELGGHYDKKTGKVTDIAIGAPRAHSVEGADNHNFHTHPGNGGENKWVVGNELKNKKKYDSYDEFRAMEENVERTIPKGEWKDRNNRIPAIADLSGGIASYGKLSLGKHEGRPILNKIKKLEDEQEGINKMKDTLIISGEGHGRKSISGATIRNDNPNPNRKERAFDKFDKRYWDNYDKIQKLKEKPVFPVNGSSDIDTFSEYTKKSGRPYEHSVIAPDQDFQALHRVGPGYKRTVIFDRTPRKAR